MSALATTCYELFGDNLVDRRDKPFVIDPGDTFTYGDVAHEADRVAAWLIANHVRAGDRVVIQMRKRMREVAAMLAVAKAGGVVVNVSITQTAEQLRFVIADCGARAAILDATSARALPGGAGSTAVLVAENPAIPSGYDVWDALPSGDPVSAVHRLDTDLAWIIYTSGSTGTPKGVMLSHRNILAGARSVARYLGLREDDRLLSVLPYSFDYGLNQLTTMMLMGGVIVHQPVAMATEVVRTMQTHAVTGVAAVPPLWIQIVRLLDASPASFPALRRITNSGGKIPDTILERMPEIFPTTEIFLMYGLTEAFRSTFLAPARFREKMGSMGRAIPGSEIYVIRHGTGVAGPGEQGELVHRGPLVSQGYWNRPDATAEKIRPCPELSQLIGDEPVAYSGDIVRIDDDGDLWFVGRNDALIKSSGFRISPDEVENLVHRSGLVTEAIAFGVADELLGQSVHLAATLLPDATSDALMAHCRGCMPSYMVPRVIHIWPDTMPRTSSGKLARPDVVRTCEGRLHAAHDSIDSSEGIRRWL